MTDDEPYLIKRYSNRKLYDSVRRKFTTLDEVAKLLESGIRILVRDHDTGVDRTDEVLSQVLRRRVQGGGSGSGGLLADLLRAPADVAKTVVDASGLDAGLRTVAGLGGGAQASASEVEPEEDLDSDGESTEEVIDRQQAEISELRDQVSQLTQAVSTLIALQTEKAESGE